MLRHGVRLAIFALAAGGVAIAQDVISAQAGLVYFVEGQVSISGGVRLKAGAKLHQLKADDTLFVERGRAEVLLNPGTVLRLGPMSRIRMDSTELTDTRISMEAGSAVITVNQAPKLDRVELRMGGSAMGGKVAALKGDGVYRFDTSPARLRVYGGEAEISSGGGAPAVTVKRGQMVSLDGSQLAKFDTADADALELWAEKRGGAPAMRTPPTRMPVLLHAMFGGRAKTPSDLVRFVNQHLPFDWRPMGIVNGPAGDILEDCGELKPDCSAALVDAAVDASALVNGVDLSMEVIVLRRDAAPPMFLRYRREGTAWEFAGAYGAGGELEPEYRVTRRGMKIYLTVTRRGVTRSGVAIEMEDWIDLAAPVFEPAISLFTSLKFSQEPVYETTESITSWETGPIETVHVEYRASAQQDDRVLGSKGASATFVRRGDRFIFDPSRSTVPETARWGEFNVDGVRLLAR